jgi:hypothetical protein
MADLVTVDCTTAAGITDLDDIDTAASATGDTAEVGPGIFLYVNNADDQTNTVTIATPGTVDGHAIADATLAVLTLDRGLIPLTDIFRGANGRASITYNDVTSVTVAVIKLGV